MSKNVKVDSDADVLASKYLSITFDVFLLLSNINQPSTVSVLLIIKNAGLNPVYTNVPSAFPLPV
jgi:hypothetical protein